MSEQREVATLGGGCFWCLDAIYRQLRGVERVDSGYAGGRTANPSYEDVCSGRTGHAEVVQVTFDPSIVSYRDLLDVFFTVHDPTTPDRQGPDVGTQYRSIILYHSPEQERIAREAMAEVARAGIWDAPLVTQLVPAGTFYPAESYHQDYHARNGDRNPYCRIVIEPKVAKFRRRFLDRLAG